MAGFSDQVLDDVALAPVDLPRPLDVLLVVPRDDRRALDELLRRGPDGRPVRSQRVDQPGESVGAGNEPGVQRSSTTRRVARETPCRATTQ